jgi:hypothetical protein
MPRYGEVVAVGIAKSHPTEMILTQFGWMTVSNLKEQCCRGVPVFIGAFIAGLCSLF